MGSMPPTSTFWCEGQNIRLANNYRQFTMRNFNFYNAVTAIKQDFNWVWNGNSIVKPSSLTANSRDGFIKESQFLIARWESNSD
jgi:hypothetical protein